MSWEPTTYDELGVAKSDGRLVESASLELKLRRSTSLRTATL